MVKRCKGCDKDFPTEYPNAKWCSENCKERWGYRNRPWYRPKLKVERSCIKCGAVFMSQWPKASRCEKHKKSHRRLPPHPCAGCSATIPGSRRFCLECKPLAWVQNKYGLTVTEYKRLLAANEGRCGICRRFPQAGRRLAVDHCHDSGKPRGLLCTLCNTGMGMFSDNPGRLRAAARYLDSHGAMAQRPLAAPGNDRS